MNIFQKIEEWWIGPVRYAIKHGNTEKIGCMLGGISKEELRIGPVNYAIIHNEKAGVELMPELLPDYEKCNHVEEIAKSGGAYSFSTKKIYCKDCFRKKIEAEGSPFDALKNAMLGFINNYPNPLTEKEIGESIKNPYKIHNNGRLRI